MACSLKQAWGSGRATSPRFGIQKNMAPGRGDHEPHLEYLSLQIPESFVSPEASEEPHGQEHDSLVSFAVLKPPSGSPSFLLKV